MGEGELRQRYVLSPLLMDSERGGGLIYQREATV